MVYRSDIDGLRSLAILPVVIYHSGLPLFGGGYVGVDVFFVISGFLITSIIVNDVRGDGFSLLAFYERRARRILPALTVVVATTLVAGWFLLLPREFMDLGKAALATAVFASNVHFLSTLDYFGTSAEFMPLLHTWSLAVEEQFYLFFPPLVAILLTKVGRTAALAVVLCGSAVSLVIAVRSLGTSPDWVFYLIYPRAWELGIGAALALAMPPALASAKLRDALGIAGLLAILVPALVYTSATPFPGLAAVPPVIGTAILIYLGARGGSRVTTLLSMPVLVGIGLISFSLYLWHWPIMAFVRILSGETHFAWPVAVATLMASFAMAWVSYRWVERPFRARPPVGFTRATVFSLSLVASVVIVAIGFGLFKTKGAPWRLGPDVWPLVEAQNDFHPRHDTCFDRTPEQTLCDMGAPVTLDKEMDFLVWGDSHVDAMMPAIDASALEAGKSGLFAAYSACPPIQEIIRIPERPECTRNVAAVWDFLETRTDMPVVILGARWTLSVEGTRYKQEPGEEVVLDWAGDALHKPATLDNAALFEAGLLQTITRIQATGRKVVILGPVPEVGYNVPKSYARNAMLGWTPTVQLTRADFEARAGRTDAMLQGIAAQDPDTRYFPVSDKFCDAMDCKLLSETGVPLYHDDDHISYYAARTTMQGLFDQIWASAVTK